MRHEPTLPSEWTEELAYLFGLLIGDGSLPNTYSKRKASYKKKFQKRHHIYLGSQSVDFLEFVYIPSFKKVFGLYPGMELKKRLPRDMNMCRIESKKIYEFLQQKGFITGRKAKIARVPDMPENLHVHFLAGLLDADGGKKGDGFGLSTASINLATFCASIFLKYNIPFASTPWFYKEHYYQQIYVSKKNMHKIISFIPIRHPEKIKFVQSYRPNQKPLKKSQLRSS